MLFYFNACTMHLLFYIMINKCTIKSQIITLHSAIICELIVNLLVIVRYKVRMVFTITYTQKWYEVLTTALLKSQSSGTWCPRRLEPSTYTSPILFQAQQNPRYIHKPEMEKRLCTRPWDDRLQTLWWTVTMSLKILYEGNCVLYAYQTG